MGKDSKRRDVPKVTLTGSSHLASGAWRPRGTWAVLLAVVALVAASFLVVSQAAAQAPKTFNLKLQTAVPAGDPHIDLLQRFNKDLQRMSNGRIKFEILPVGAVVGRDELLDAVDKGVVDAGFAWTHFWTGKHPAAGLFSAPMGGAGTGLDQMSHLAWMFEGEGQKLYRELYQKVIKVDVVPFQISPDGPEALGWFKKPPKNVAEFRRMKYRAPPGLPGKAYVEMGVPVVSLSGEELIPAAERGVIDAGEWINPLSDIKMGLQDVFKFYSLQGLHQAIDIADLVINGKVWRSMPADLQAMIEVAARASVMDSLLFYLKGNSEALVELVTKRGVKLFDAPEGYASAYLEAANKVLETEAARDPFFRKVLDSMRAFAKTVVPYKVETTKQSLFLGEAGLKRMGK